MKQLFKMMAIVFACMLTCTSCSKSDLIPIENDTNEVQTRSVDLDFLGKPVRFVLPQGMITNQSRYFFSARHDKTNTILSHIDDGSGRQRFIIEKVPYLYGSGYYINIVGGAKGGGKHFQVVDGAHLRFNNNFPRTIWNIDKAFINDKERYRISYTQSNGQRLYLHGWKFGSAHLRFDQEINDLGIWSIGLVLGPPSI